MSARNHIVGQKGFSLVEVIAAVAIGMIAMLAFTSFQVVMQNENRAVQQKFEVLELHRLLAQTYANDSILSCQIAGKNLIPDPANQGTYQYVFTGNDALKDECTATGGSGGRVLAQPNAPVPGTRTNLRVASVRLAGLQAIPALPIGSPTRSYYGNIEVSFVELDSPNPDLVRPLRPIRLRRKFTVATPGGFQLASSGDAKFEVQMKIADTTTINNQQSSNASIAECPIGTIAISGGWFDDNSAGAPPVSCPPQHARVDYSTSERVGDVWRWKVLARCHAYRAVALCYRPNVDEAN